MTFDEYNTDENFDKKESSLDELVKLGIEEGKTSDEIKTSLSPKWQKSKKIGEFDNYVKQYSTPKEEPKAEEVTEKVIEEEKPEEPKKEEKTEAPKPKTDTLSRTEKDFIKKQDELNDNGLNAALNDVEGRRAYNWEQQYETGRKAGEAYNRIDDKLIAQLPTFLFRRYQNDEFGDISDTSTPEGRESKKNAQLRLAHFVLNGVQSKLKNASNAFMITAGKSPIFSDTTSDYEKYQQSNFAKGMENRWKKYGAETQNAIDMVAKETNNEQGARLAAEDIAKDNKLNTRFNMMTTREKADLINIKMEIGKLVGKMDLSEIADFMTGEAINGDLTTDEAIAIGVAQLVKKSPELLKQLPEGKYKDMILGLFGGGSVDTIIASLGGAMGGSDNDETPDNPDSIIDEKKTNDKWSNPTGNLRGYKALDGKIYDFNTFESKDGKEKLVRLINDLDYRFRNGEIDAETFRKYREPLYKEAGKHTGIKGMKTEEALKWNVQQKLKDLNADTGKGKVTVDSYKETTAKILEMAKDVGMSENEIEKLKKDFKLIDLSLTKVDSIEERQERALVSPKFSINCITDRSFFISELVYSQLLRGYKVPKTLWPCIARVYAGHLIIICTGQGEEVRKDYDSDEEVWQSLQCVDIIPIVQVSVPFLQPAYGVDDMFQTGHSILVADEAKFGGCDD